jgi:hypothetical protein
MLDAHHLRSPGEAPSPEYRSVVDLWLVIPARTEGRFPQWSSAASAHAGLQVVNHDEHRCACLTRVAAYVVQPAVVAQGSKRWRRAAARQQCSGGRAIGHGIEAHDSRLIRGGGPCGRACPSPGGAGHHDRGSGRRRLPRRRGGYREVPPHRGRGERCRSCRHAGAARPGGTDPESGRVPSPDRSAVIGGAGGRFAGRSRSRSVPCDPRSPHPGVAGRRAGATGRVAARGRRRCPAVPVGDGRRPRRARRARGPSLGRPRDADDRRVPGRQPGGAAGALSGERPGRRALPRAGARPRAPRQARVRAATGRAPP